ncbi:MAG: hypothetical protein RLZZ528_1775 [Pseudomonadota bacterium]|jgi:hypothetical protein
MVNPWRGEVAVTVDGVRRTARLTLGVLAELEAETGADGLVAIVERFEGGRCSARDILGLLAAGLRGGGWAVTTRELGAADIEGGPVAAARAAAALLAAAFTPPEAET